MKRRMHDSSGPCTVLLALCLFIIPFACAFDALDPTGNISIIWDITSTGGNDYNAQVRMFNYHLYRKIDSPGWALMWNWTQGEFIWSMDGAEATELGDCTSRGLTTPGSIPPHNCDIGPTIVDMPAPTDGSSPKNCCRGGVLSDMLADDGKAMSLFTIHVGNVSNPEPGYFIPPGNFSINQEGFKCTPAVTIEPSILTNDGVRFTKAMNTWEITCTYSQRSNTATGKCCVSLSAFYNDTIIPCTNCACACGNFSSHAQICSAADNSPYLVQTGKNGRVRNVPEAMECSPDGCPISIHYHIKTNYKLYWRAKITVVNRNLWKNFTNWNLAVEHPAFNNFTEVFSWNMEQIQPFGVNNSAVFWGEKAYNDVLMPAGPSGNVQSEMLFAKDYQFTFSNGWAFPRKIVFNGEECIMPDVFPRLPSGSNQLSAPLFLVVSSAIALLIVLIM